MFSYGNIDYTYCMLALSIATHMEEEKPHFEELLLEDLRNYHYCGCREMKLTGAAHVQTTHKKAVQCSLEL